MLLFLCGAWLGAIVGIGYMCLIQINIHGDILKDEREEK